jgi:hypothetical protein
MITLKRPAKYDGRTNQASQLIQAIEQANKRCFRPPETPSEPCETDKHALLSCEPPRATSDPEATVLFRKPILLEPVEIRVPPHDDVQLEGFKAPLGIEIGCLPLFEGELDAGLAVDLVYEQRWFFRNHIVSALATTIALAPNETLRVTIRNTQRKLFDQTTLDEVEKSESTESTTVDRDIINVTRSSTKTNNWNVSGDASVTIPIKGIKVGIGLGGGFSQSVTETAQYSAEQVNEATQKSASSLRTLQKVEVKETVETVEERERSRTITNPYRDRALRLNVFNLGKEYCVEFALTRLRPVIILELNDITFSRGFVIANGDFLEKNLQDSSLRFELPVALEAVIDNNAFGSALEDVQKLSELALKYLFDEPDIFKVPGDADANIPDSSFDAQLGNSGLNDALAHKLGIVFTTLNYYFALYRGEVAGDKEFAVSLALSLEEALRPLWLGAEETDDVKKILDTDNRTEIFRRLGGFLAFVSGAIRPLLQPAEEDRERIEAARRAEFVIGRVVDHLQCHKDYYIGQFLRYLAALTGGLTIKKFVENALSKISSPPELKDKWTELFAVGEAFVDKNSIVVPGVCLYDEGMSSVLTEILDGKQTSDLRFGILLTDRVIVPTDGTHIEPAAGSCVLADVPEPAPEPSIRVSSGEDPLHVSLSQEGQ